MESLEELEYEPAQDMPRFGTDMRRLAANTIRGHKVGPSSTANTTKTQPGVKRKREAAEEDAVAQPVDADMHTEQAEPDKPPELKKMRTTCTRNVTGVTSSRCWKVPAGQRSSASQKHSGKSWDLKVCLHRSELCVA